MLSRRALIIGSGAALINCDQALANISCSAFQPNGVQLCQVGIDVSVETARQQLQNWCWADCIQAIFAFHGFIVSQSKIVEKVYGSQADLPVFGAQIAYVVEGEWMSDNGRDFEARAEVLWD